MIVSVAVSQTRARIAGDMFETVTLWSYVGGEPSPLRSWTAWSERLAPNILTVAVMYVSHRLQAEMDTLLEGEMAFATDTHEAWCRAGGVLVRVVSTV